MLLVLRQEQHGLKNTVAQNNLFHQYRANLMKLIIENWKRYLTEDKAGDDAVADAIWGLMYQKTKNSDPTNKLLEFLYLLSHAATHQKALKIYPDSAKSLLELQDQLDRRLKEVGYDSFIKKYAKLIELGKTWILEEISISTRQRTNQGTTRTEQTGYMWKMK